MSAPTDPGVETAQVDRVGWELDGYRLVVGLEVHVELTELETKMFSPDPISFGAEPNTMVSPVSAGLPGSLPVVNAAAVAAAARLGLALNCDIAERCQFHRKNYFYPDLPKNYQISQYDVPLCSGGWLEVTVGEGDDAETVRIGIERVHMEEDTAKSTHAGETGRLHGADRTFIDLNRAGVPLLECVSRPDIRHPDEAQAYLRELVGIARALRISDAKMEEGSIRCDANVSVHREGEPFGTRTEIKNVNSVRSLGRAIAYEAERQVRLVQDGGEVVQETRHWDEGRGVTETLRRKETLADYRYFPDPDLVPVVHTPERVEELRASLPELPAQTRGRLIDAGVAPAQAATIVDNGLTPWLDEAVDAGADAATVGNWLSGDLLGKLGQEGLEPHQSGLTGRHIGELVRLIEDGTLSNKLAKQVLETMVEERGERSPAAIAQQEGLEQVSDEGELQAIVDQVIADNPDTVETIRAGNAKAIGALVGEVMKATRGQADPRLTNELLRKSIAAD
ncbi:MAG: Asp-tRNA(Asn)/Glu-tRNA(Gln) amidotransferase subunit GatB [Nitriliruptorales bacterium]|nr:Asp-tRNA(Asn)/Glu-tRNA(Gln) amidotransferase subunit GatB [Nitriliruptorales bacterium]